MLRINQRFGLLGWVSWAILLCVGARSGAAQVLAVQNEQAMPETSVANALYHLSSRAAVAFVGRVETIERTPGVVEVSLRVEQVIQGQPGPRYVLREWAGRWPPGLNRYMIGQRALFFLQAPSAAGLSSPVDGGEGVVPVLGETSNPYAVPILDTRRLSTRLQRKVGDPLADEATMTLARAAQVIAQGAIPGTRRPENPSGENPWPIVRENAPGAHASGGVHDVR